MYFVYVLRSQKNGHLYKGQTHDLDSRILMHNSGLVNYTKKYIPWVLVYFEVFETRSEAMKRESYFKTGAGREFIKRQLTC